MGLTCSNENCCDDLVTREGASRALDRNVRTIGRALAHVQPDDEGPPPKWKLSTVPEALAARDVNGYSGGGGASPVDVERICAEVDWLAEHCQRLLDRLEAEPDQARRLELLQENRNGKVVGRLFDALDRSVAIHDEASRPLAESYVHHEMKGKLLGRICI